MAPSEQTAVVMNGVMLNVIVLIGVVPSVVKLNVIMLIGIMLTVIMMTGIRQDELHYAIFIMSLSQLC
jgi:hypothetical protein